MAVIHKHYRPNGTPDLRRWVMECDSCQQRALMISPAGPEWLVPAWPDMAIFCPDCFNAWADHLIAAAITCPDCGAIDLRMWHENDDLYPVFGPHYAGCPHCGYVLLGTEHST